jgi:L-cysteine/cystine lyase
MPDDARFRAVRECLPAAVRNAYFNTGTAGPLPLAAVEAVRAKVDEELSVGRIGSSAHDDVTAMSGEVRERMARLINADSDEIALTHHTTEGVNVAVLGVDWQPGDEVVTSSIEHISVELPLRMLAEHRGVVVRSADVGLGEGGGAEAIAGAIGPRTRMVVISHVSYATGARLDVDGIAAAAHAAGAIVVVDAAQSAGAIPVDVKALGVDAYAMPGQKWLCGPEDTGSLFVARGAWERLRPAVVGYASVAWEGGERRLHNSARRYEVGSRFAPAIAGQLAALRWLQDDVGVDWIQDRVTRMTSVAREMLASVPGVTVLTPANCAGLLSFTVEGVDPVALVTGLAKRGVLIRWVAEPRCARIAVHFFNDESDLEKLVRSINEVVSVGVRALG